MPKKGATQPVVASFERIVSAIKSLPLGTEFSRKDIQPLIPDVPSDLINRFFFVKRRSGWLERVHVGRYRAGGVRIKTSLPQGLVSEAVWAVLFTDKDRRPMTMQEIVGEAEAYVGRPSASLYGSVSSVLHIWSRNGSLERTGKRNEYKYRLKDGTTERPITTRVTA